MVKAFDFSEIQRGPTTWLFEGGARADAGISMFIVRTRPGRFVELHTHPYPETFLLLEGRGRWTAGDEVVELEPEQMLVVPPETPHGFRNIGDEPLLVVTVHESGTVEQTFLGRDPA
jgi:mannose-6-phosphate isomerase-like protein (cupin superfamily)